MLAAFILATGLLFPFGCVLISQQQGVLSDWAALMPHNMNARSWQDLHILCVHCDGLATFQSAFAPKACWQRAQSWSFHTVIHNVQLICDKPVVTQLWHIELFISDLCSGKKNFLCVRGKSRRWVTEHFLLPAQRFLSFLPWRELPLSAVLSFWKSNRAFM